VVNINTASPQVLTALLDVPRAVVDLIHCQRLLGSSVTSLDHLLSLAPPSVRPALMGRYQELTYRLAFSPSELVVTATGGVGDSPLRSRVTLTVVPTPDRVAVIRREVE
jgi:hypothetical protein